MSYHEKAVQIREQYAKENGMDLARSYNNIGNVYYYLAKDSENEKDIYLSKAEENYKQSLQLREKILPEGHPSLARIYVSIGNIFFEKKLYETAKEWMNKGLRIRLRIYGDKS